MKNFPPLRLKLVAYKATLRYYGLEILIFHMDWSSYGGSCSSEAMYGGPEKGKGETASHPGSDEAFSLLFAFCHVFSQSRVEPLGHWAHAA